MQEFLNLNRGEQVKREAITRVQDFRETYEILKSTKASEQASRCIGCGNPFCHSACPLGNFIPFWLRQIASTNLQTAFKLSNESNPFPEITGRVCPQERLCEGACTLADGYGAVMIGAIESSITEEGLARGMRISLPDANGKSVAVIGSGPASLSCATYLLRAGYGVSMYEAAPAAGGLLRYGIPGFKLDKSVVSRRFELLGDRLELYLNCEVGKDIEFDDIASKHDAVFVGIGARKPRRAGIAKENANGSFMALDFLTAIQMGLDGDGKGINLKDKRVLVVGGGDTAMDCVRSSLRLGAKSVTCVYRRSKNEMGGSKKEYYNAKEEGASFVFNAIAKEILTDDNGFVSAVVLQKSVVSDGSIRLVANSEFNLACDIVVFALGFSVEAPSFLLSCGVVLDSAGRIVVGDDMQSSCAGIYAGGDCVRGSDLVVTAAADGKVAAKAIIKALR